MRSRLSSRRGDWKTVGLYFKDMRVLQDGDEDYPEGKWKPRGYSDVATPSENTEIVHYPEEEASGNQESADERAMTLVAFVAIKGSCYAATTIRSHFISMV